MRNFLVFLFAVIVLMAASSPAKAELTGDGPRPDPYVQEDPVMGPPPEQSAPVYTAPQSQPTYVTPTVITPDPMPITVPSTSASVERYYETVYQTVYVDNQPTKRQFDKTVDNWRDNRANYDKGFKFVNTNLAPRVKAGERAVKAVASAQDADRKAWQDADKAVWSRLHWHDGWIAAIAILLAGAMIVLAIKNRQEKGGEA